MYLGEGGFRPLGRIVYSLTSPIRQGDNCLDPRSPDPSRLPNPVQTDGPAREGRTPLACVRARDDRPPDHASRRSGDDACPPASLVAPLDTTRNHTAPIAWVHMPFREDVSAQPHIRPDSTPRRPLPGPKTEAYDSRTTAIPSPQFWGYPPGILRGIGRPVCRSPVSCVAGWITGIPGDGPWWLRIAPWCVAGQSVG